VDREAPTEGAVVLADGTGDVKRWFDVAPGSVVLLRPDRIVAAICQPWNLASTLQALSRAMDLMPLSRSAP
jgi:3-(3-hydroxy-phenyl)propionate hydroxylase